MLTRLTYMPAIAAMLLLCAVALVSCDPWPESLSWSARLVDGELEIAFCEPAEGDELTGYIENRDGPRWTQFWNATGEFEFTAGDILQVGVDAEGLTTNDLDLDLLEQESVVVVYRRIDGITDTGAAFELDPDAPPGSWVTTRGSISNSPCG